MSTPQSQNPRIFNELKRSPAQLRHQNLSGASTNKVKCIGLTLTAAFEPQAELQREKDLFSENVIASRLFHRLVLTAAFLPIVKRLREAVRLQRGNFSGGLGVITGGKGTCFVTSLQELRIN